jgi:hypothetical protein
METHAPMSAAAHDVNPATDASEVVYEAAPVFRAEHGENTFTRMVEQQAAKVPSDYFLVAALGSMCVSLGAELTGRIRVSRFVGMWPGPLLVMGVYIKLVKSFGAR